MNAPGKNSKERILIVVALLCWVGAPTGFTADHNDPNAVNSIFSDIPISAADLYGMFGYPTGDLESGENVVVQLTFAPLPKTGIFDRDMMYKIKLDPDSRITKSFDDQTLDGILDYAGSVKDKYVRLKASEIRVSFNGRNQAKVDFLGFPGGDFSEVIEANKVLIIESPSGHAIKAFLGGRDDPFFNDLPGFFRSINYGPQFYKIPTDADEDMRELPIPKTLLELDGNAAFNFRPTDPYHGQPFLEADPYAGRPDPGLGLGTARKYEWENGNSINWSGDRFHKDQNGNYSLVYSGKDAQAGINVNALIFEIPLSFISRSPEADRIVRTWGESYVFKASEKIEEYAPGFFRRLWNYMTGLSLEGDHFNDDDDDYNRVDTVGVPFLDAGLSERADDMNVGANNVLFARQFVIRFGHLGWGFGPSITALGLPTCFDHDDSPVSVHKTYKLATAAFPRSKKCFFQALNMPDESWHKGNMEIPLRRTFELFVPNLTSIDMDTTGTWPFGRRPEDQVASRFLSTFLDMSKMCGDEKCNIETLQNPALWAGAPLTTINVHNPHTPNPLANDKTFLDVFPYLAEPWGYDYDDNYSPR